jgi:hypothetical protein
LTLFSKNDNRELFYQTIDLLFITGTKALFQIALSLLSLLHEGGHLENFNLDAPISTKEIIQNASNFKVSNKLLKALEKKSTLVLRKKNKLSKIPKSVDHQNTRMFSAKHENFLEQNSGDDSCYFEDIDM